MKELKKAQMGIITVLAVMLVSMKRRLPTRRFSSGITTLALAGIVLLVAAGSASAANPIYVCQVIDATTDLDGSGVYELQNDINDAAAAVCIYIKADNVVLDGQGYCINGVTAGTCSGHADFPSQAAGYARPGIAVKGQTNVTIKNVEVKNFCTGIMLYGSSSKTEEHTVENCTVHDNGNPTVDVNAADMHGIALYKNVCNSTVDNNQVYNNTGELIDDCDDSGAGIAFKSNCKHNNITNNLVYNNTLAGIYSKKGGGDCYNYIAYNNVHENGQTGIDASFTGGIRLQCKSTDDNTMEYNIVTDNIGPGIFIGGHDCSLRHNIVSCNKDAKIAVNSRGDGVRVDRWASGGGKNTTLYNNTFCNNEHLDIHVEDIGQNVTGDHNIGLTGTILTYSDTSAPLGKICEFECPEDPDLIIEIISETRISNTTYKVTYTVKNIGNATAPAGHDTVLIVDGDVKEHKEVPALLNPCDTYTDTFNAVIGCTPETDNITVCADDYNEVSECREDNNCMTKIFPCRPVLLEFGDANLTYPSLLASDGARHEQTTTEILGNASQGDCKDYEGDAKVVDQDSCDDGLVTMAILPMAGQTVTFEVTESSGVGNLVANILIDLDGNGDWTGPGEHVVTNMALGPAVVNGNYVITSTPFPAVGADVGSTWLRLTLTRSNITSLPWDGTMTGHAAMIPFNCGETEDWQIEIGDAPKPDLNITKKDEGWINATHYNITYTVTNIGGAAAGVSTTSIEIDGPPAVATDPVPALAAGANHTATLGPYAMTGNSDTIKVCADSAGVVAESDETNNCTTNTFSTDPEIKVSAPTACVDGTFFVDIDVDPNGCPVYGVQYKLTCNTSVMKIISQREGTFLSHNGNATVIFKNETGWTGSYALFGIARQGSTFGETTPGTLANITFQTVGGPLDCGAINLTEVVVSDNAALPLNSTLENDTVCKCPPCQPPVASGASEHKYNNYGNRSGSVWVNGSESTNVDVCGWDWSLPFLGCLETSSVLANNSDMLPTTSGCAYLTKPVTLEVSNSSCYPHTDDDDFEINVFIEGDANGDCVVNVLDASMTGLRWMHNCTTPKYAGGVCWGMTLPTGYTPHADAEMADGADLNNDCEVNILDTSIVGINWGKRCSTC